MKYSCKITLPEKIYESLKNELETFRRCTIDCQKDSIIIEAQDAVALRAALSSVGKLVLVHEKATGLK